jgi:hypothetical protein
LLTEFGIAGGEFVWVRVETNPLSAWSRQFELLQTSGYTVEQGSNSLAIHAPAHCKAPHSPKSTPNRMLVFYVPERARLAL